MLANFTKDEFHQFIMLYLEEQINSRWELVREDNNEAWYDFLEQLDMKKIMPILVRNRPKYNAKVRSQGRNMIYVIDEASSNDKIKVMT